MLDRLLWLLVQGRWQQVGVPSNIIVLNTLDSPYGRNTLLVSCAMLTATLELFGASRMKRPPSRLRSFILFALMVTACSSDKPLGPPLFSTASSCPQYLLDDFPDADCRKAYPTESQRS